MSITCHDTESVRARLRAVQQRIAQAERQYGRAPGAVTLLAVSKASPALAIQAVHAEGQTLFGESYLQEALPKIEALQGQGMEWHFIGPLQSNKTKHIAQHFAWAHSIDREHIAQRLSAQRCLSVQNHRALPPLNICLQVKVGDEAQKAGVNVSDQAAVMTLAHAVAKLPQLKLRGLMAIPVPLQDFDAQRRAFSAVRKTFERLNEDGLALDTLSMGMSNDMEAAIAEGATIVRIGSAIFSAWSKVGTSKPGTCAGERM